MAPVPGRSYVLRNEDGTFTSAEQPEGPPFPDDLDTWSFIQGYRSPFREPLQPDWVLFLDEDGRETRVREVADRVERLAAALTTHLNLNENDVLAVFSPNCTNWGVSCWTTYRAHCIFSPSNPSYTAEELIYQLSLVQKHHPVKAIFVHPATLDRGLKAAQKLGLSSHQLILLEGQASDKGVQSIWGLLHRYRDAKPVKPVKWAKGESRKRLALITASSGVREGPLPWNQLSLEQTTGLPKIIAIPHYSVTTNVIQFAQHYRGKFRPQQDRVCGLLPQYHIFGFICGWMTAGYMAMPFCPISKFSLEPFLRTLAERRLTILYLAPPLAAAMVKTSLTDKYDLSHLRVTMFGGAPLGNDLFRAYEAKFPQMSVGQAYGMTETCTIVFGPAWTQKKQAPGASCGVLVNGITTKIIDPSTGKLLGFGERGELCIRSPSNALGYMGNDEANRSTFIDGFVHSGDEAYVDEEGNYYITDRLKELIKVKGFQVAPAELEDHLLSHQSVQDVCVIGVHDDWAGEVPRAYVVLTADAGKRTSASAKEASKLRDELIKYVKEAKAPSKQLKGGVVFVDSVPKTPSGKLLRRFLRQQAKEEMEKEKSRL